MSHSFNEARVKVAHPYLTIMGLYLGGFTGMLSETCLNIALPQLAYRTKSVSHLGASAQVDAPFSFV